MAQARSILDTPIFHKLYDLYKLIHSLQIYIPKTQRYSLWLKCENTTLLLLEILIETGQNRGAERLRSLFNMSNKLDLLKVLFRLAKDTKAIDSKQYLAIQIILQEIGKMLGGWIKAIPLK